VGAQQLDVTRWSISARPLFGHDVQSCLERDEVEDSVILTSYPGVLNVWLRSGTPRAVADEIAACLRSLPGEPLDVRVGLVDEKGLADES
jgi:hypothetical protein